MSIQPVIQNDTGAILTIGCLCNGERLSIVEPYGLDDASADLSTFVKDLIDSWVAANMVNFLACCSQDLAIVFLSGEGMRDGRIPYRTDYAVTAHKGTISSAALPTSVCGLISYYCDPADVVPGHRLGVAKTFFPGLPDAAVTGQAVSSAQQLLYGNYASVVIGSFASVAFSGSNWWRMLSAPKPRSVSTQIPRIEVKVARGYVATQKRRLVPR